MPELNLILGKRPVVPTYRFDPLDRIVIHGIEYAFSESDASGHVFVKRSGPAIPEAFTNDQVHALLHAEPAMMEVELRGYAPARVKHRNVGTTLMSELSDREQAKVLVKQEFCLRWIKMEADDTKLRRSDKCMKPRLAQICHDILHDRKLGWETKPRWKSSTDGLEPPPARTLRRWLKIYDLSEGDGTVLKRNLGRSRKQDEFTPEEYAIQQTFARQYASSNKPTMVHVYSLMRNHIKDLNDVRAGAGQPPLKRCSLKTFQNRINSLPPFLVYAGRYGEKAARAKFAMVMTGVGATYPLERVEADEWRVNLQTLLAQANVWCTLTEEEKAAVQRSRLWFSGVIDVATKCILGFRVTAKEPSTESSVTALEMAVCDTSKYALAAGCGTPWDMFGTPETVATDSGAAYASRAYQVTVNDLCAGGLLPPSGEANLRGTIERVFQTLDTVGLSFFTGRTFGSILAKGDYDSEGNASLCMDTLNMILIRLIVDVYHNTPHAGLGGETPRNAWLTLTRKEGVLPPPTGEIRRHIFGTNAERKITAEGISFLGIFYNSPEIQELRRSVHNRNVLIRVDRFDLSAISVWSGKGWRWVPARLEGLQGVSVWAWIAAAEKLRAVNRANTKISEGVVKRAIDWLRHQAAIARAEAELASPVLTDEYFRTIERRLTRHVTIVPGNEGDDVDFEKLGEWTPSAEYSELVGVTLAVFKEKPATGKPKKRGRKQKSEDLALVREDQVDDEFHGSAAEDEDEEDGQDQFGSAVNVKHDF